MRFNSKYLLNVVFGVALVTLIVNDCLLKDEFHNGLTGKLSDFAGLTAFFLALHSMLPKKHAAILSASVFLLWNSPLTTSFIELGNSWGLPLHRTIDLWDNMALIVLFPLWYYDPRKIVNLKPIPRALCGMLVMITFCQTTCYNYRHMARFDGIPLESTFKMKHTGSEDELWRQIQWGFSDAKIERHSTGVDKDLLVTYYLDSVPLDTNCILQGLVKFNLFYSCKKKVPRLEMTQFFFIPDSNYYGLIPPRNEDLSGICNTCIQNRIFRNISSLEY